MVLSEWAERVGMVCRPDDMGSGFICNDLETAYHAAEVPGGVEVSRSDHGNPRTVGRFGDRGDAERFVLLLMALPWRSEQGMPDPFPADATRTAVIDPDGGGYRLRWRDGSAWFRTEAAARRYSHVIELDVRALSERLLER